MRHPQEGITMASVGMRTKICDSDR